ncbi:TspO/MBR family protein [uncultured Fibrella sp.]|uniref:TspO/MBR family protein n=1 Tax=uncultured Fibrella sp. TaxID=1284596 RepID=UPI0035CAA1E5
MLTATQVPARPIFRWWHALIIFVVANAISLFPAGFNGDEAFYNQFKQPSIAPPDWLFPPAWLFNNITSLYALAIVANKPVSTPYRRSILWLEAVNWALFAFFTLLYFGLKSPVLGAIDTVLGCTLTGISLWLCFRVDKRAGWGIAPRFAWLLLASYVSVYVALNNSDAFFGTTP